MDYLNSFATSRSILINGSKHNNDSIGNGIKRNYQRGYSQKVKLDYPNLKLIKINKKNFPKDFFNILHIGQLQRYEQSKLESRRSNDQTVDTPNPQSYPISFQSETLFNKTSFFGPKSTEAKVSKTPPPREKKQLNSQNNSLLRNKNKRKLQIPPIMIKSNSSNLNQLYNCTFSKNFYQETNQFSKSLQKQKSLNTVKTHKKIKNISKWNQFFDLNPIQNIKLKPTLETSIQTRTRKVMLISNRPATQLPKINS